LDKGGGPSFNKVMRGLRLLQQHEVEYNILTTVNSVNADYTLEVYRFLRDEAESSWIQFIPVVERINEDGLTLYQAGNTVSDRSVRPKQLGDFLCRIFDEWVLSDVGSVYVQTFEAALRNWLGMDSSRMCVFNETCGTGLAIEHNGDLYSCDHFVEPDFLLGNIKEKHMIDLVASPQQLKFETDKIETLPQYCLNCEVLHACHGECPKNRFIETPNGEPGLNYLCAGFRQFFNHADFAMRVMVGLVRRRRQVREVMEVLRQAFAHAERNDPCPCGSGRKFKYCHGNKHINSVTKQLPDPESRSICLHH
jgi:uncharacterized protein